MTCGFEDVLVFDELDRLLRGNPRLKELFLEWLRSLKERRLVRSVVGIGAQTVLLLKAPPGERETGCSLQQLTAQKSMSPFNVCLEVKAKHFTFGELDAVVREYAGDYGVKLPSEFSEDIYGYTQGYDVRISLLPHSFRILFLPATFTK